MGKKLSVVLPSYNEEQMIEKTAKRYFEQGADTL